MIHDIEIHLKYPMYKLKCISCGGLGYNSRGMYSDGEPILRNCGSCGGTGLMGKPEKTEHE